MTMTAAELLICDILSDKKVSFPTQAGKQFNQQFVRDCLHNQVHLAIYQKMHNLPEWQIWPEQVTKQLKKYAQFGAIKSKIQETALIEINTALINAAIRPLLLKGAAIANRFYPSPLARPYSDIDLLIDEADQQHVVRILQTLGYISYLGYQHQEFVSKKVSNYQMAFYKKIDTTDYNLKIDLHWRVSNSQVFSQTFSYHELINRSESVMIMRNLINTLNLTDSLLFACMHLVRHFHSPFYNPEGKEIDVSYQLRWLFDIHLIASCLTSRDWQNLISLCQNKRLCGVCLHCLQKSGHVFGTIIPDSVEQQLIVMQSKDVIGVNQFTGGHSRRLLADLKVLSLRQRIAFIKEQLFPPAGYMMKKYNLEKHYFLPFIYIKRIILGLRKLTMRQRHRQA